VKKHKRWLQAQTYEKAWWDNHKPDLGYFRVFAKEVQSYTAPYLEISSDTRILEIGCGPAGAIAFLQSNYLYGVDPLESFFSAQESVQAFRNPHACYKEARGENLPFPDNDFDLVILDNVLDHCELPTRVLDEIDRVLRSNGIIFFRQNVYLIWGRFIRWLMEQFLIDRGHPHTFSRRRLLKESGRRRWHVRAILGSSYWRTWLDELTDGTLKGFIKALLLVTRSRVLFILQKQA